MLQGIVPSMDLFASLGGESQRTSGDVVWKKNFHTVCDLLLKSLAIKVLNYKHQQHCAVYSFQMH
jgi:hypothetical protein